LLAAPDLADSDCSNLLFMSLRLLTSAFSAFSLSCSYLIWSSLCLSPWSFEEEAVAPPFLAASSYDLAAATSFFNFISMSRSA